MTNPICLGLDPGYSGALAVIDIDDSVDVTPWPETERDVWHLISPYIATTCFAVLEQVHSMPHDGVASSFKFGRHYGMLRAFLIAADIPFVSVTPQKWQAEYGLSRHKGESKGAFKGRGKEVARKYYPTARLTNKTADALLLAEYCRTHFKTLFNHATV